MRIDRNPRDVAGASPRAKGTGLGHGVSVASNGRGVRVAIGEDRMETLGWCLDDRVAVTLTGEDGAHRLRLVRAETGYKIGRQGVGGNNGVFTAAASRLGKAGIVRMAATRCIVIGGRDGMVIVLPAAFRAGISRPPAPPRPQAANIAPVREQDPREAARPSSPWPTAAPGQGFEDDAGAAADKGSAGPMLGHAAATLRGRV